MLVDESKATQQHDTEAMAYNDIFEDLVQRGDALEASLAAASAPSGEAVLFCFVL